MTPTHLAKWRGLWLLGIGMVVTVGGFVWSLQPSPGGARIGAGILTVGGLALAVWGGVTIIAARNAR